MAGRERFRFDSRTLALPLRSRRLVLRPPGRSDVPTFLQLLNDPVVHRGTLAIPLPYHRSDAEEYLRRSARNRRRGVALSLQIVRRSDGLLVGGIGLYHLVNRETEGEIGYWIGAPYRGLGYATEALDRLGRAAFRELGIHRLVANIFPFNRASAAVVRKGGYRREGFAREAHRKDGVWRDEIRYARLATDPPVRRAASAGRRKARSRPRRPRRRRG